MRVAFFADTRHPNAVNWMQDLVALFDVEVHAVDYSRPDLGEPRIVQHRVTAPPVPGKLRHVFAARAVRRVLRRVRPDLVLGFRVVSYGFAAAAAGVRPLALAGQGANIVSVESPPGSRWFARYALRRADLLHAWTETMAAAMRRLGADASKIQVLHRGIRTDLFTPADPHARPPRIVTSRQLQPYYRTDLVLRAVADLRQRGRSAELRVCGEGPERADLEELARDLGIPGQVRFEGRLDAGRLAAVYRECSVYASMVPTDGLSSSLLEAMSCGLVPVVVDNESNRPWVRPGHGHLVPAGDPVALADALDRALEDTARATEAGLANRALVMARADRKTNLGAIVERWRELAGCA